LHEGDKISGTELMPYYVVTDSLPRVRRVCVCVCVCVCVIRSNFD